MFAFNFSLTREKKQNQFTASFAKYEHLIGERLNSTVHKANILTGTFIIRNTSYGGSYTRQHLASRLRFLNKILLLDRQCVFLTTRSTHELCLFSSRRSFFLIKATKILLILPYLANVKDIKLSI